MSHTQSSGPSRREVLKAAGGAAAVSALAGVVLPQVHAAEDNTIQRRPDRLRRPRHRGGRKCHERRPLRPGQARRHGRRVSRIGSTVPTANSNGRYSKQMDVPNDRKFIGFDAYKHAMDCLKPGDVAIFATPLAFRWVHFGYAIEKGLNVFMEKPLLADGPTAKKMFEAGRGVRKEEHEGRRRPDVPALRRPPGAVQADQGRCRSATSPCCGPTG